VEALQLFRPMDRDRGFVGADRVRRLEALDRLALLIAHRDVQRPVFRRGVDVEFTGGQDEGFRQQCSFLLAGVQRHETVAAQRGQADCGGGTCAPVSGTSHCGAAH